MGSWGPSSTCAGTHWAGLLYWRGFYLNVRVSRAVFSSHFWRFVTCIMGKHGQSCCLPLPECVCVSCVTCSWTHKVSVLSFFHRVSPCDFLARTVISRGFKRWSEVKDKHNSFQRNPPHEFPFDLISFYSHILSRFEHYVFLGALDTIKTPPGPERDGWNILHITSKSQISVRRVAKAKGISLRQEKSVQQDIKELENIYCVIIFKTEWFAVFLSSFSNKVWLYRSNIHPSVAEEKNYKLALNEVAPDIFDQQLLSFIMMLSCCGRKYLI